MFFFIPETVVQLQDSTIIISCISKEPSEVFAAICNTNVDEKTKGSGITIQSRFNENEYLDVVKALQKHILRGDCYEINFCQEFFAANAHIHPSEVYAGLTAISPNPFTAFYKIDDRYLLCASPERYLKKTGNIILSQPMKGTWERDNTNAALDSEKREQLYNSSKDRSENVMIVDLVRNDLSKICEESSVHVDELFGVYSFPQVHQMISTISGRLKENLHWTDAVRATFPMGSMTGAPKKRVMELIEQYERTRRGLFSGAVGYVTPQGDFDFNVVIRSILYNAANKYLSYQVGSGITFYSDPIKEYEECMLKAAAIKKVLALETSTHKNSH
jgi:para-aminobenzoate synthetase component 1